MWLTVGGVVIPPVPLAFVEAACRHYQGLEAGPARRMFFDGDEGHPAWYAGVKLLPFAPWLRNPVELDIEMHSLVSGETARLLDAVFAAADSAPVTLSDGATTIDLGMGFFHAKLLVRDCGTPADQVWLYELVAYSAEDYRSSITRRHAWTWPEVMLDTFPRAGSPPFPSVFGVFDPASEVGYVYGGVHAQFASGCRFSPTLKPARGQPGTWERDKARFWTLEEAREQQARNWAEFGGRLVYGGRIRDGDATVNMPRVVRVRYLIDGTPPDDPLTLDVPTGYPGGTGRDVIDLTTAVVKDAANFSPLAAHWLRWEDEKRRVFGAVLSGLVPWRTTPFDTIVEWRLPIDGFLLGCTILHGVEARSEVPPDPTLVNPAPAAGTITVTFTRPADDTTPPAGQLTRAGYGSSPAFVPPAMTGTSKSYAYTNLADGTYTVAPGSPWSPTSASATVANGSSHTLAFTKS